MRRPRAASPRARLAIAGGQREGLTRLMQRLTSPADHGRLPDVSTVSIERYVNSFEIAEEKVGPNQYLGVINVSYVASRGARPAGVGGHPLRHSPIRSDPGRAGHRGERRAPTPGRRRSPWRDAWYRRASRIRPVIVVLALPLGDLADIAAAPPGALLAGDPAVLEALGARYGATTVIVATATRGRPRLVRAGDDRAAPRRRLGERRSSAVRSEVPPDADLAAALKPVVAQAVLAIEDDWKQRTADAGGPGHDASARPCRLPTSPAGCR